MEQNDSQADHSDHREPAAGKPFVVVAGFGLPGRSMVDLLRRAKIDHQVIELNPQTCERASTGSLNLIRGDARDPAVLKSAGVERATLVALMVPIDSVVLEAVSQVRKLNSTAYVIARCAYTSSGLEAVRRGANETIVAEQIVARALDEMTSRLLKL